MQIAGVQPVGSKGLSGLQLVVSDRDAARSGADARANAPRTAVTVHNALSAEPVVFPRDGLPMDRRPLHLRHQKAAARYREAADLDEPPAGPRPRSGRE